MKRNFMRENRETPSSPAKQWGGPEGAERQVLYERRWGVVRRYSTTRSVHNLGTNAEDRRSLALSMRDARERGSDPAESVHWTFGIPVM
jgi:hypothetical protein